jgi:hypothetical protein
MNKLVAAFLMAVSSNALANEDWVFGSINTSTDSDASNQREISTNWFHIDKKYKTDISVGEKIFEQSGFNKVSGQFIRAHGEVAVTPDTTVIGSIIAYNKDVDQINGSLGIAYKINGRVNMEGNYEKTLVDSIPAINNKIYSETFSISSDVQITDETVLVAGVYKQLFSDSVNRTGYVLKVIYSPKTIDGLAVQIKYKTSNASIPLGYVPPYFSPLEKSEVFLTTSYAKAFNNENSVLKGYFGIGQRDIDNTKNNSIEYGIKLSSKLSNDTKLNLKYECTKDFGSPSYEYCTAGIQLGMRF